MPEFSATSSVLPGTRPPPSERAPPQSLVGGVLLLATLATAGLVLPVNGGLAWFVGVLVITGGGLLAWRLQGLWREREMQLADERAELVAQLEEAARPDPSVRLCGQALPLLAEQVEGSRRQSEEAITDLSQRFKDIKQRLSRALSLSSEQAAEAGDGEGADAVGMLRACRADLDGVVRTLETAIEAKRDLMNRIAALENITGEMRTMAGTVSSIAYQTNLLALNAAIEASHAGEEGKGFAVVADQIRNLSDRSGEAGKEIGERVEQVNTTIRETLEAAERYAHSDDAESVEETIKGVLDAFERVTEGLERSAETLREESGAVREEVAGVIVSLQFQDRVTQVLTQVEQDMGSLREGMEAGTVNEETIGEWTTAWRHHYDALARDASPAVAAGAEAGNRDITFF